MHTKFCRTRIQNNMLAIPEIARKIDMSEARAGTWLETHLLQPSSQQQPGARHSEAEGSAQHTGTAPAGGS